MSENSQSMNQYEKCQFLKNQIEYLYSKEGRSISYLSRLFDIQRYIISRKLKEWDTPLPTPKKHLSPSQQKFVNRHRQTIIEMLDNDETAANIAAKIGCTKPQLEQIYLKRDDALIEANRQKANRRHANAQNWRDTHAQNSMLDYNIEPIDGEIWKPILGYEDYEISNMGRIRAYSKLCQRHYLKKQWHSKDGYVRVTLTPKDRAYKSKTMLVHRLVAQTFIEHDESLTFVNHKDGNKSHNNVDNLEWITPTGNNEHYYKVLKNGEKTHSRKRKAFKDYVEYNGIHFTSITALAKYMGISRTTLARRMQDPAKFGITIH